MNDSQFEKLIEEIKPANMSTCLKSLMIPSNIDEGDEWKRDMPTVDDVQNNITVPFVLAQQIIYCSLTEQQESILENLVLENFQTVTILNDAELHIHKKDSDDHLISYYAISGAEVSAFAALWQQKTVCAEFRFYIGDSLSIKGAHQRSIIAKPPRLLFAIGGVWDENHKSWMYEPFSQSVEIWPTVRLENL